MVETLFELMTLIVSMNDAIAIRLQEQSLTFLTDCWISELVWPAVSQTKSPFRGTFLSWT
jgi:hypothetical protein